jgi:hypothetical protein
MDLLCSALKDAKKKLASRDSTFVLSIAVEDRARLLAMKKGDPKPSIARQSELRRRVEQRQEAIVAKCHPAIFEIAQLWKESIAACNSLGADPPPEILAELEASFEKRSEEIHRKYSGAVPPEPNTFATQIMFSSAALESKSDQLGVSEWIHFERHRTPLKVDVEKRSAKDYEASRRILRTGGDLEALRCNRKIQAFKGGEIEHRSMFETLWGFGLENLTPEELALFFDEYCPCDKVHDPDALKKSRNRFRLVLQKAIK